MSEFLSQTNIAQLAALAFGGTIGLYVVLGVVLLPPMLAIDWASRALGYGQVFGRHDPQPGFPSD